MIDYKDFGVELLIVEILGMDTSLFRGASDTYDS